MPAVVADSSPIIYLARLGQLDLLRSLYLEVLIPSAVWREVAVEGKDFPEGHALLSAASDGWIRIEDSPDSSTVSSVLERLDDGEREAIALALHLDALLIIDEAEGRAVAAALGVKLTGTLGVLVQATRRKLLPKLKPELERLVHETNFRCAEELLNDALKDVGEDKL